MAIISRGFKGRRPEVDPSRLPPGQYVTQDFPVLSAGPTPRVLPDHWTFEVTGLIDKPRSWTWEEFNALPSETVTLDIHCVTKWSKLDTHVDWCVGRHPAGGRGDQGDACHGVQLRRLHDQSPTGRRHRGPRLGRVPVSAISHSTPSTVGLPASSCRISISGRAPSGSEGWNCWRRTGEASGSGTDTTTTGTRGGNSGTGAIEPGSSDVGAHGLARGQGRRQA